MILRSMQIDAHLSVYLYDAPGLRNWELSNCLPWADSGSQQKVLSNVESVSDTSCACKNHIVD